MTQSLPEKERLTTRFWWKCPLCELEFDNGVLAQAHYDEPCKATQVKEAIQRTHEKQGDGYFTHPDIATMQDAARAYVDRPQQPPEQCLCGKDAIGETVVCSNCIRKPPDNGEVAEAIKTVEEYAMTIAEGIGSECWEAIYTLIQAAQSATGWQPMPCPQDGEWRLYRLVVHNTLDDSRMYEVHQLRLSDNGNLIDTEDNVFSAWEYSSFEEYQDIPAPTAVKPEEGEG